MRPHESTTFARARQTPVPRTCVFWAFHAQSPWVTTLRASPHTSGRGHTVNAGPHLLAGALVAAVVAGVWAADARPRQTQVTCLSVGDADCAVVQAVGGRAVLVDGGGADELRSSAAAIRGVLLERGIRRLDAILLSRGDREAVGGTASVLRELPVGCVLMPGDALGTEFGRKIRLTCDALGVPIAELRDGQSVHTGAATLTARVWRAEGAPSAVGVRVVSDGASVLLLSVGDAANIPLILSAPPERAVALRLPDLGGGSANPDALLDILKPRVAVLSRGFHGQGASDPTSVRVVGRLDALGARTLRTDLSGSITLSLHRGQVGVATFRRPSP
jgi:competence protein ComEC